MIFSTHVERSNPYDPEYDPYDDPDSDEDDAAADARAALKFGGANTPMFTGSAAAWEFGGGEEGDPYGFHEGRRSMRTRYREGAEDVAGRMSPEAQAAMIQQQQQEQFRQQQMAMLSSLQQRAAGQGPTSMAEQEAVRQGELGKQSAMGVGVSARGAGGSSGLRAAKEAQAQIGIGAQQQQQMVRVQEQQQAQQALGGLAGTIRGADIGLATSQAGMQQQTNLANQQAALQQTGLNDSMVQFYTNMGFNLEQAQIQAQIARQQQLSDLVNAQRNAQAGIINTGLQSAGQNQAAIYGAIGTGIYGAASAYNSSNSGGGSSGG